MKTRGPLFLFGFPRSGTNLLRATLTQHSRIEIVHEPELVWALCRAGHRPGQEITRPELADLQEKLRGVSLCARHLETLDPARLERLKTIPASATFRQVYEWLLPAPDATNGIWGEKSLNNAFFCDVIERLYPQALFLHLVRDPRAAVMSLFRKRRVTRPPEEVEPRKWPPPVDRSNLLFFRRQARLWSEWIAHASQRRERLSEESWLTVRYEDLVREPEATLQRLCGWAGVALEDSLLQPEARAEDPVLRSDRGNAHQLLASDFDPSRARSFTDLPPTLRRVVEEECGPGMGLHGYEPYGRVGLGARIHVGVFKVLHGRRVARSVERALALRGVKPTTSRG